LPALQGIEFPAGQFQRLMVGAGGQVVQMQNHPVAPGRMLAAIAAMKSIGFFRQPLQVDQAGEGSQLPVQGHFHLRL
jgi:hypothetical protein